MASQTKQTKREAFLTKQLGQYFFVQQIFDVDGSIFNPHFINSVYIFLKLKLSNNRYKNRSRAELRTTCITKLGKRLGEKKELQPAENTYFELYEYLKNLHAQKVYVVVNFQHRLVVRRLNPGRDSCK